MIELSTNGTSGGGRILIVEDEPLQARMLEGMLATGAPGQFEVVHVDNLTDAKRFLAEQRAACVLLDLTLPDARNLDGLVAVRNTAPEVPVVVVTADDDKSRAVKAVQAGAQDFLIKGRMDGEHLCRSVLYAIERQTSEMRLAYKALHDPLTGLANRSLLHDRLTQALAGSIRTETLVAVHFIDIDQFKALNDTLGHEAGDGALRIIAGRLLSAMRPGDTVSRVGGDEFVIVDVEIDRPDDALLIGIRLTRTLTETFPLADRNVGLTASMGIALASGTEQSPSEIIGDADAAMYRAKRLGGAGHEMSAATRYAEPAVHAAAQPAFSGEAPTPRLAQEHTMPPPAR
jgi:diguanylate cyclase (GGDEF)-like protein